MTAKVPEGATRFCGPDAGCYANLLYHWQTLVSGLLALLAALIAGWLVWQQIKVVEQIEKKRLARRETAVRAVLPLTLTTYTDFAEQCARLLIDLRSANPAVTTCPDVPQQAITDLEKAVEATGEPIAVEHMAKLAAHTQVLHSTLSDVMAKVNARPRRSYAHDPNLAAWDLRTALVYAAASSLFEWARGEIAAPDPVTWRDVSQALSILHLRDHRTTALLERRQAGGNEPLGW